MPGPGEIEIFFGRCPREHGVQLPPHPAPSPPACTPPPANSLPPLSIPVMPFMDMPERGLRAYYTTNPTWPYSPPSDLKFGRAAQSNSLDPLKENLVFVHPSSSSLTVFSEQVRARLPLPRAFHCPAADSECNLAMQFTDPRFTKRFNMVCTPRDAPRAASPSR